MKIKFQVRVTEHHHNYGQGDNKVSKTFYSAESATQYGEGDTYDAALIEVYKLHKADLLSEFSVELEVLQALKEDFVHS